LAPDTRIGGATVDSEHFHTDFETARDPCAIMEPIVEADFYVTLELAMPKFVIERDIPGAGKLIDPATAE